MDVDEMISDFSALKISAISKAIKITQFVDSVTIGPNSILSPPKTQSPRIISKSSCDTIDSAEVTATQNQKQVPILSSNNTIQNDILSGMEKQRKEIEHQSMDVHKKTMDMFNKVQEAKKAQQWKQHQALKFKEIQYQADLMKQAMNEVEHESKIEIEKASARNKQRQQENVKLLKAKAEEQQKQQKLHSDYATIEQDIVTTIKEIDSLMKTNQEAKSELLKFENDFKHICSSYKSISTKIRSTQVHQQDIKLANDILQTSKQMKELIKNKIKAHYEKREREAAETVAALKKKEEEKLAAEQAALAAQQAAQTTEQSAQVIQPTENTPASSMTSTIQSDDKEILTTYVGLQTFLQQHQQSYKQLLDDQSLKQFKFDCKKAVNLPVNAISAVSSEHLRDKYNKLYNLLSGKTVQISDSRMNASQHPQGIAFVMDLLAKKFVLQGDLTISSNPDAAFAYATIIVTLWNDFPIFGKLLLAHFYKECPYLLPIYFQKQEGQSDEQFYTLMGYQYNDGVIEKQDKFLKRITGICKLYFSILISNTKRGTPENPHHLGNGWTWFARTLNRVPYVDVTATAINSFLEVAGSTMQETYGRQFKKLIIYLVEFQIPLLKEKDSGGPLARLEVLLQNYYKTGKVERPMGILSSHFW
ncbi:mRNA export factor Gle1-like [Atheta coriaria]|uniref:mRNA export factor Gle1-like n=1 Tax=Dalotia coriaria TaxID=877792 RepID=UPI0031F34C69